MYRLILTVLLFAGVWALAGCEVQTSNPTDELPIWYPTFIYKASDLRTPTSTTQPSVMPMQRQYDQTTEH